MLTDGGFEGTHDLGGEKETRFRGSERRPVVGDLGENASGVDVAVSQDGDGENDATRGAGEFGRGDGDVEWETEQFGLDGGRRWRAIDQEGDGGALLEAPYDFEESEGVASDDDGFDAASGAGSAADFCERRVRFFHGEGEERDAVFGEERRAEFPVAEVRSDEEDAAFALEGFEERAGAFEVTEEMIDGAS
jgi:hypothetical protein